VRTRNQNQEEAKRTIQSKRGIVMLIDTKPAKASTTILSSYSEKHPFLKPELKDIRFDLKG
jgi:nicotinamide riboside kinase